jgi:hypothetical protein
MTKDLMFRLTNPNHQGMPYGPSPFAHVHFTMKKKSIFFPFCMGSQGFENVGKIEINFHKEKDGFKLQTMNMIFL